MKLKNDEIQLRIGVNTDGVDKKVKHLLNLFEKLKKYSDDFSDDEFITPNISNSSSTISTDWYSDKLVRELKIFDGFVSSHKGTTYGDFPKIDYILIFLDYLNKIGFDFEKFIKENSDRFNNLPNMLSNLLRITDLENVYKHDIHRLTGRNKPKGSYSETDEYQAFTSEIDIFHNERLGEIRSDESLSKNERKIEEYKENILYYRQIQTVLNDLVGSLSEGADKLIDKILKDISKAYANEQSVLSRLSAETIKVEKENYKQRSQAADIFYSEQRRIIQESINSETIGVEAGNIYLLGIEKSSYEDRLKFLNDYRKSLCENEDIMLADREGALLDVDLQINDAQSKLLQTTSNWLTKYRELTRETTSIVGINDDFDRRRKNLIDLYETAILYAKENGDDVVVLEQEKQRRIDALNFEQLNKLYQLQELTGVSWAQEYDHELAMLENYHRQGMISEKNYQKAQLQMQVNNVKKYYDYYSQLTSSMFTAIQDAEIAASDAKYDVLIRQAENNGEDTAALEQEKENKKLEIQKKYADVNFAIKISEIIANTAVAIMQAFAQLGPIGGAIAAAMLTATGIAQVVVAKAERDKIKNMQPGNAAGSSAGASTPATAERVLSGFSEGGYTGDGDRYEVAGVVHRGEYVVPKPIMDNPRVVDAVGTIEAIRRNKLIASAPVDNPGFADGGYTGAGQSGGSPELTEAIRELRTAVAGLDNIRAYVVFKDLEKARDTMDRARSPFTRNKN